MRYLLCSFLLAFTFAAIAQHDFRKGFVVLNNSDTLPGEVDYRGDVRNAQLCTFKNSNGEMSDYKPGEIMGYRFLDDKYYISETIELGNGPQNVFLEYIVDGISDLYYYRDADRREYFFIRGAKDNSVVELKNTRKEIKANGNTYEAQGKEYIDQLKSVFFDAPDLNKQINELTYTRSSFTKVTKRYHQTVCKEYDCKVYEKKVSKGHWAWGVTAGYSHTKLKSNGTWYYDNMNLKAGSVAFGAFVLGENLKGLNERLAIQYSLLFTSKKYKDNTEVAVPNSFLTRYVESELSINSLQNILQLNYSLTTKPSVPFLSIGAFYSFQLDAHSHIQIHHDYSIGVDEEYDFTETLSNDWGFLTGIGYRYSQLNGRRILLKAEYLVGFGIHESSNNTPPTNFSQSKNTDALKSGTFQLLVGCTL